MSREPAIWAAAKAIDPQAWDDALWRSIDSTGEIQEIRKNEAMQDAKAAIEAALPYLAIGYASVNPYRHTIWMEQGTSEVADDPDQLRPPKDGFLRCALVPVED